MSLLDDLLQTTETGKIDSFAQKPSPTSPSSPPAEAKSSGGLESEAYRQPGALPSPLIDIADAIAAVPRSPFLNDLTLSRAAATFIVAERAAQAAPPALRAELHQLTVESFKRTASEIRQAHYKTAYEVLDALAGKVREMRAH